ncbi:MAG: phytanoyl-CoA dioxygenase family protein [Pseudomonadota bacterium]
MADRCGDVMECLSDAQKAHFDEHGYLLVENQIPPDWLQKIRDEITRFEAEAATMTTSNDRLDLEDSHTADDPRLRRIKLPHTTSDVVRELMYSDHVLAPARDLIGPNLRLHTTKLNMKSAGYGAAVEWHQDYAFYPHTNDDIVAIGICIDDMAAENGPLMVYPGSHKGPVFDHHVDGVFAGAMLPEENGLDSTDAVQLTGPAGSISIHHGRIVHGSALNTSDRARRILFYEMMAADAFPIMGSMTKWDGIEDYNTRMLCGAPTLTPRLKNIPIRIPQPQPDVPISIYEIQKGLKTRAFDTIPGKGNDR